MMENKQKTGFSLKQLFIPEGMEQDFKEISPFLLLTSLAIGGLFIAMLRDISGRENSMVIGILAVLALVHAVLYWMIMNFAKDMGRKVLFFVLQAALIFSIIMLSGSMVMLIGLYCSLLGTLVGFMGRTRLTVITVILSVLLFNFNLIVLDRPDNFQTWLPGFIAGAGIAVFFAYFFNYQMEARVRAQELLADLEEAHKQLSEYALEVEDLTLTNERQRMARELHDTLAQGLAGLILQLEAADLHLEQGKPEKSKEILQLAMSRARSTLVDARQAIDDLRNSFSGARSLGDALNQEAERFQRAAGIACQISLELPDQLEDSLAEHIFRIATEGLENILRHAQAKSVQLSLAQNNSTLVFDLQDDGVGFDQEAEDSLRGHYGLLGIRERVRLAGGSLTIESRAGEGTKIRAVFPLDGINGGQADE